MDIPQNTPGFVPRKGGEDDLPFDPKTLAQKDSSRQVPEIDLEAEPPSAATIARLEQEENDLETVDAESETQLEVPNEEELSIAPATPDSPEDIAEDKGDQEPQASFPFQV